MATDALAALVAALIANGTPAPAGDALALASQLTAEVNRAQAAEATLAPKNNPTFTGMVNAPAINLTGTGLTGDITGASVTAGGTTLALPSFVQAMPLGFNASLSNPDQNIYVTRTLSGTEDSGSRSEASRSAFNALLRYDRILQPGSWYGVGAAAYNNGTFYGFNAPARGGVMGWRTVTFLGAGADDASGKASGEVAIGAGFLKAVSQLANKNMAVWGLDLGIDGPASNTGGAQEATFTGMSYQLHKMTPGNAWVVGTGANNGADYKRPAVGIHLLSYPQLAYHNKIDYGRSGLDDSPAGVKMYPLDAVFATSGCSGAIETVLDCDNAAATPMANTVFRMGGTPPGPYINPGTNAPSKSRFLNGFEFSDYTGIAAWFRAKHAAADANTRSIKVEAGAGSVEINDATKFGSGVSLTYGSPALVLNDIGGGIAANQKRFGVLSYLGDVYFQRQNDDGSAVSNMLTLNKEGSRITFGVPVIETNTAVPASSTSGCTTGQHAWDANYEYRCVATNTWKRAALSTW